AGGAGGEGAAARRRARWRSGPVFRGHPLDPLDGCALERTPVAIRELDDMLASAAAVGRERRAPDAVAGLSQTAQRPPKDTLGRVLYRPQLRTRPKRGAQIRKTKRGKGAKGMGRVDGAGTPLGAYLDAASPAEVTLLEQTLASQPIRGKPERLIGDRGYDSNAVRRFLKRRHIQPIIPARSNNTQATDQDGRCLRRY